MLQGLYLGAILKAMVHECETIGAYAVHLTSRSPMVSLTSDGVETPSGTKKSSAMYYRSYHIQLVHFESPTIKRLIYIHKVVLPDPGFQTTQSPNKQSFLETTCLQATSYYPS